MLKINLGCGIYPLKGYINIDYVKYPGVDFVADLTKGIPSAPDTVDEIYMSHVFEHIPDNLSLLAECYRVCKNGARVKIIVPHCASANAFADPTHYHWFNTKYFICFTQEKRVESHIFAKTARWKFKLIKNQIRMGWWWMFPMQIFANLFKGFYESHLMYIFQPSDIYVEFEVVK
jgi:predicted SAM-dependent methyltransferase